MRSFMNWLDNGPGFYVNRTWDEETQDFLHTPGKIVALPLHRKIFNHVLTVDPIKKTFPYTTFMFSCPKKSGKTAWGAAMGAWYADVSYDGTEIYVLANDREQAEGRMMKAIKYDARHHGLGDDCVHKYDIQYPSTTVTQVLSSHYTSAAGGQQALTLWDELWGYLTEKSQRLWEEMTPIPTEKLGLRVVVTYAGWENESQLLWDLYESSVINGIRLKEEFPNLPCYTNQSKTMFVYWDHEPRMPWQTPEYYEQQLHELRPVNFRRLHLNQWGSAQDQFIDPDDYTACEVLETPLMYRPDSPFYTHPISVGVDVGVKRDTSAVVGVYYNRTTEKNEEGKSEEKITLGVAFHKIWTPPKGEELNLENTVEAYLKEICKMFTISNIYYDPTHLYRSMQTLRVEGLPVTEFTQTIPNMVKASTALYEVIRFQVLSVYPDSELRNHIKFAAAKAHGSGFRIIKNPDMPRPVDGAIAMAMAVYDAVQRGGEDTSEEQVIESPYSDCTAYSAEAREGGQEDWLPLPLRG